MAKIDVPSKKPKQKKGEKIVLELSNKADNQLEKLREDLKAESKEEVVVSSLRLMKELTDEILKCGSEIIIENRSGKNYPRRLIFSCLW